MYDSLVPVKNILYILKGHVLCSLTTFYRVHTTHNLFSSVYEVYLYLSRRTADEEPLVNGAVNLLRWELLVRRQRRQLVGRELVVGVSNSGVGTWSNKLAQVNK